MNCAACNKTSVRTTRIATIVGDGPARRGRVCAECAKRGVFIVPVVRAVVVDTDKAEQKAAREVLAPFIKRCESLAKASRAASLRGDPLVGGDDAEQAARAEAYEAIAHMLKEGRA